MNERERFVASPYVDSEYPVDGPDADDLGLAGRCGICDEPIEKGRELNDPLYPGEILCAWCADCGFGG